MQPACSAPCFPPSLRRNVQVAFARSFSGISEHTSIVSRQSTTLFLSLPSCAVHRARVAVVGPVFPGRRQRRLQGQIYAHNYEAFAIAPYFREENEFYSICMASLAPTGSQSRKRVKEGRAAFDALCCFRILCATALTMMRSPESGEHIAFSLLLHASARSLFAWFTVVGGARVEGTRSTLRWQHCRTAVGFFTMDD